MQRGRARSISLRSLARRIAGPLSVALLAAGCAAAPDRAAPSRDVVVLLPDAEGKTGAIVVSAGGSERVLTKPRQAVTVAPGRAPSEPFVMTAKEVRDAVGPALDALPRPPARFVLYFRWDSTELAAVSAARVGEIVRTIRERASTGVSVVGHTDTVGGKAYNNVLSLKRARAVAARLAAEGVKPSILKIASHGKCSPLIATGDQVPEPRNRRVEVTVR